MSSSCTASSDPGADSARHRRYAGAVIAGVVAVLVATEVALRLLVVPLEEGWAHRVDLVYRGEGGDVVIGDSHTFRGFVTRDEFVNLSGGGSSAEANEIVVREYFRHRQPGRVIVAASPQLFARSREAAGAQQHDEYFVWNLGLPVQPYVFEPGIARHVDELLDPADLLERTRQARERRQPGNPIDAFLQRELLRSGPAERERLARKIVRKNRPVGDLAHSDGFAAYRRTLEFLLARGAELCLLRTAVTPRVEELSEPDPSYRNAHRAMRELAAALGVRYVDYRDFGVSFEDELFIDPDHLTATGAELFARGAIRACFGPPGQADLQGMPAPPPPRIGAPRAPAARGCAAPPDLEDSAGAGFGGDRLWVRPGSWQSRCS